MIKELRIEELRDGSSAVEIGRLVKGEVIIGRGEGCGITVDNSAVSRQHGLFLRIRHHWLYKDLGSTNGSWLNGAPLTEGQWKLVRPGDLIQIADLPLRLKAFEAGGEEGSESAGSSSFGIRSLIVFSNSNFLDEYPVPENGPILLIGGLRADLKLKEDDDDEQKLVLSIERRDSNIEVSGHADVPVFINEEQSLDTQVVEDRDIIRIGQYTILVNDPFKN